MSSENRTHDPSPRKIGRARLSGYVAQSRDLGSAVVLSAMSATLVVAGRAIVGGLVVLMQDALRGASGKFSSGPALDAGLHATGEALAVPFAAAVLSALAIHIAQTRGLLRGSLVLPDSARLVPRLRRLLSADSAFVAGSALVKTVVLLVVAATALVVVAPVLLALCGGPPRSVLEGVLATSKNVGTALTLVLLGLGLVDYLWQLARYSKSLRMSAGELKREQKESEGDPVFKHERRRIHLDLTRAFAPFADADVVVSDPHRLTVVIRYAPELAPGPMLACRGRDTVASRIESMAVEAGVPIAVNPDLAASLDSTEEGDEIPEWLYERVAEVIADAKFAAKVANRAERPHTTSEVNDAQ